MEVIYNGVDVQRFRPMGRDASLAAELGLGNSPVLITIGRLVGWKGLQVIMRAMPHIKDRLGRLVWLVVGEGDYCKHLKELSRRLGVEEAVRFVGMISHDRLPRFPSLAHHMVQPSIGDEAFGITMVEAMSCGVPVVASRIGGIPPEVVADKETGLLVLPGDETGLANSTLEILTNEPLRLRLPSASRQRVLERFDWDLIARRHPEIFQSS